MSAPPISIIEFGPADDIDMNLLQKISRRTSRDGSISKKRDTRPKLKPPGVSSRFLDMGNFERSEDSLRLSSNTDTPPTPPRRTKSASLKPQQRLADISKEAQQRLTKSNKEMNKGSANDGSFESLQSKPSPNLLVVNETRNKSQYKQRKSGMTLALVDAFHDSKSSADSQTTPNRRKHIKGTREKSLRNVVRHKSMLEKELPFSNVFTYAIRKCSTREIQTPEDGSKMPVETVLKMKQPSEGNALQNNLEGNVDTWQQDSLKFYQLPRHGLASEETESLNSDEDESINGDEDESIKRDEDEDDCRSVASLTVQDLIGSYSKSDAPTASMTEDFESQTLSLSMNDMYPDLDEHDKINFKGHTRDFPVVDPSGRMGTYVGSISRSSGLPCGIGLLEYHDTGEIFEGRFVHGFWAGYGKCIYPSGDEYTGFFEGNIRHGHGIMNYSDGRSFDGTYTNGIKVEGRMTYQDGSMYFGRWSKGTRHGKGTYTFLNGAVFLGEFCNDTINGTGVLTWSNGGRFVGQWRSGVRHGHGTEFRPDGTIRFNGIWIDGRREQ
jgi:hypothetical protein